MTGARNMVADMVKDGAVATKVEDGRLAVVTGAASGIGRETARLLARHGCRVVAADIDEDGLQTLVEEHESLIRAAPLDVAGWDAVARFGAEVLARDGVPDYVVCAAGINPLVESTAAVDEEFWDRITNINIKGMFATCRALAPAMAAQGGGSIVNLASVSGLIGWGGSSVYNTSKGAAIALTKALAIEYAASGLRVNCVCPGSIRTPMVLNNLAIHGNVEQRLAKTAALHPLGRVGETEEVAATIHYLLSDAASFITGVALPIDGGLTAI